MPRLWRVCPSVAVLATRIARRQSQGRIRRGSSRGAEPFAFESGTVVPVRRQLVSGLTTIIILRSRHRLSLAGFPFIAGAFSRFEFDQSKSACLCIKHCAASFD